MLTRAGFGNDPGFSHPFDEQTLAHHVIGLVGSSMVQIFSLDVYLGTAKMLRKIFCMG